MKHRRRSADVWCPNRHEVHGENPQQRLAVCAKCGRRVQWTAAHGLVPHKVRPPLPDDRGLAPRNVRGFYE